MSNAGFILVYVENVAASEAFYASILGRPAVEFLADLRDAARRAEPHARLVAPRRRQARGDARGRGRDRFSRGQPSGSRRDLR